MNLNTVRVFVRDLRGARTFYGTTLGLPLTAEDPRQGFCLFNAGNVELVVEAIAADAPANEQALVGRVTGFSFLVADVWRTFDELKARSVVFTSRPIVQHWGGTVATFKDPDGNVLQIVQRPASPAQ